MPKRLDYWLNGERPPMKLILKFFFWLWHKDIARRLKDNPLGHFFWLARVEIVYKPLFKERGLEAVLDEHDEYIKRLEERLKKKQRPPTSEMSVLIEWAASLPPTEADGGGNGTGLTSPSGRGYYPRRG